MKFQRLLFFIIAFLFTYCAFSLRQAVIITNYGSISINLYDKTVPIAVENFIGLATGEKEWIDSKTGETKNEPFYDNLIFHRVIKDFMIQTGCPLGTGTGNPGYSFQDEIPGEQKLVEGKIDSKEESIAIYYDVIIPYLSNNKNPNTEILQIAMECGQTKSTEPLMYLNVDDILSKMDYYEDVYYQKYRFEVDYATVCMANNGPNTNGSQFFIVTKKDGATWLNGKHTVFGRVTSGMEVVHKIENLPTGKDDKPLEKNKAVIKKIIIVPDKKK
ncbi:MAG: peptidylprolyl isomerase [Candidatus Cloacimonetes bacterium]|nr:peptidylprolyl isomerase [Candidatus Cloacimonadota bacterium]